jgi:AcrR family transcriptional regulator
MSTSESTQPQRADARRNREKLLEVAAARFVDAGTDVSLEAIAREAGVGIGTLYRHFPTRNALVEAAYRSELERLTGAPGELLAEHEPDAALAAWMDRFVEYAEAKNGMRSALQAVAADGANPFAQSRAGMLGALETLLDAAQAAGTVRADVDAEDVLRAMGGIWLMTDEPGWQDRARRLLGIVMDGLRAGT